MAKYDLLADRLRARSGDRLILKFAELDELVAGLPPSTRRYLAWWSNDPRPARVQSHAWMSAGWRVCRVRLAAEEVEFVRGGAETGEING